MRIVRRDDINEGAVQLVYRAIPRSEGVGTYTTDRYIDLGLSHLYEVWSRIEDHTDETIHDLHDALALGV